MAKNSSFEGLGTHWWIKVFDDLNLAAWIKILKQIKLMVWEFEQNYSRFLADSFISRLNSSGLLLEFPPELYEMLSFAQVINQKTGGYFNCGVGKILENRGYDSNYSFRSKSVEINQISSNPFLALESDQIELTPGAAIDLGGFGKGWLVDKIKDFLLAEKIKFFTINAGGDIFSTGTISGEAEFALEHPADPSLMIGSIKIQNQAIACSSPNRRTWTDKTTGKTYHHLLNPYNLDQPNPKLAVFTQSLTTLIADVGSTVLFVADSQDLQNLAKTLEIEYLIVFEDGSYSRSDGYLGKLN